jgi:two-component system cell cycle response regulator
MRILIADDDSVTRTLLTLAIRQAGYESETASDGLEAWERLQADSFSVLVVDWMMPGLDGPALIRRVREAGFPGYIYTILLTSRQAEDDRYDGLQSGADDYLTKPVNMRELWARLAVAARIITLEARLREVNASLAYQASHDRLTDLYNRPAISEYAESELARSMRSGHDLSLVLLDLDHFKAINDRYGHLAGDAALHHAARRIVAAVRPYDWVGRWGGEEFLLVLPDATGAQAGGVAERVRLSVAAEPLTLPSGEALSLTLSGGVACTAGREGLTLDSLFLEADAALYKAKRAGRNQIAVA